MGHTVVPFRCGSEQTETLYRQRVERLREQMQAQRIRYCVAPGQTIETVHGQRVPSLGEVTPEDFGGAGHLHQLVLVGKVVEAYIDDGPEPPTAA